MSPKKIESRTAKAQEIIASFERLRARTLATEKEIRKLADISKTDWYRLHNEPELLSEKKLEGLLRIASDLDVHFPTGNYPIIDGRSELAQTCRLGRFLYQLIRDTRGGRVDNVPVMIDDLISHLDTIPSGLRLRLALWITTILHGISVSELSDEVPRGQVEAWLDKIMEYHTQANVAGARQFHVGLSKLNHALPDPTVWFIRIQSYVASARINLANRCNEMDIDHLFEELFESARMSREADDGIGSNVLVCVEHALCNKYPRANYLVDTVTELIDRDSSGTFKNGLEDKDVPSLKARLNSSGKAGSPCRVGSFALAGFMMMPFITTKDRFDVAIGEVTTKDRFGLAVSEMTTKDRFGLAVGAMTTKDQLEFIATVTTTTKDRFDLNVWPGSEHV